MSVLSAGLVAGPLSPTLRDRRDVSINWGANLRLGLAGGGGGGGEGSSIGFGEGDRGEGSGVSSGSGPIRFFDSCSLTFLLFLKLVSIGTGANRRRGCSGPAMMFRLCWVTRD